MWVQEETVRIEFTPNALEVIVFRIQCLDSFACEVVDFSPVRPRIELLQLMVEFAEEWLVGRTRLARYGDRDGVALVLGGQVAAVGLLPADLYGADLVAMFGEHEVAREFHCGLAVFGGHHVFQFVEPCICGGIGVNEVGSAGASAGYLTVSEIFPLEVRAQAIAVFFSIA